MDKTQVNTIATASVVVFAAGYTIGTIINRISGSIQINLKEAKSKPQQ